MKKALSILLIAVLMFTLVACGGNETDPPTTDPGTDTDQGTDADGDTDTDGDDTSNEPTAPTEPTGEVIIGSTTDLSGDWIPYFQNNASDYDIYNFIGGQSTVGLTFAGEYIVDETVVESYDVTENEDGSKTYTWNINPNMKFSNGEPITAKHYVAETLLWNHKLIADLTGDNTTAYRLVGHDAYAKGEAKEFAGVRLLGDYSFSFTINPEFLPYFYELPMVSGGPEYWPFWLGEGVDIMDDGNGAYFSTELTLDTHKETFEAARNNPVYVSSGPYMVDSYDEATKTVVLKVNPEYAGNFEGQKPMIETVIFKRVTQDTQIDELATGQVDLLIKLVGGDEINAGFDLVDQGGFNYTDYPRAGYGKLTFHCDYGPTQYKEVRQAIAHLLDRNKFARTFTSGFGSIVNGPYGEGQWFFQENKAELNEKLNAYPYSLEDAIKVLEEGGWVYDENGNDYSEGIRYKKMDDGTMLPLVIEWASSEQNAMSDLLVVELQENPDLAAAGIKINQTVMTFNELLSYYYRDGSQDAKYGVPTYHMFNLAVNFNPRYDLTKTYSIKEEDIKQGLNTNFIRDEELYNFAQAMVLNDPTDREKFKADFVNFVVKWNDLLPDLPLYSNIYHDFYSDKVQNFNNNSLIRTSQAILYAYVTE
ncbi:ABC transporter substrate-binding protein [Fusibacter sp. JL298sf-3]